jgi:ATP citrate (pro-S)-lyase
MLLNGTAHERGLTPQEFVDDCRKEHKLIAGIGHLVKSVTNPDMRVTILKVCQYTTPLLVCQCIVLISPCCRSGLRQGKLPCHPIGGLRSRGILCLIELICMHYIEPGYWAHTYHNPRPVQVEKITTSKKSNLILNVDGIIATAFVDLFRQSGAFSEDVRPSRSLHDPID